MNAWVSTNSSTMTMAMAMAMAMAKASLCANQDKAAIVCGMQLQKNIPAILVERGV